MSGTLPQEWFVQYNRGKAERVEWFITCELAIEAACVLIHDGCDVYGMGPVITESFCVERPHNSHLRALGEGEA